MDLSAKITGIKYKPFLCADLKEFSLKKLEEALSKHASFVLNISKGKNVAVSWWVSSKRTRSYPYARVYDTLDFAGRKITIIPVVKDEGKEGDRDFLQWDTVSLMSLLGVYVIIGYYVEAEKNKRYMHKITNQRFDTRYIKEKIQEILFYQSDALHWNLSQVDKIGEIAQRALKSYELISRKTKVEMHSWARAEERIKQLKKGKEKFMEFSRALAKKAQKRESVTIQPKEHLSGKKGVITIKNYLGGFYYFTVDEVRRRGNIVYLIEGKHSKKMLPSVNDLKDGLIKMILFTNLENVKMNGKFFRVKPVLKLTGEKNFNIRELTSSQRKTLKLLYKEAKTNGFEIRID